MVKANTVLGKAATLAMLPALSLGIFAAPAAASTGSGDTTVVNVFNTNSGASVTDVVSAANSGGNTIVAASKSEGGDSGSNGITAADARANAANSAEVEDVEAASSNDNYYKKGHRGDESGDVDANAAATGDAAAYAGATSRTGNGGAAGSAKTISKIITGTSTSDVAVVGGTDSNEVDIEISDCGCDKANTYYEESMRFVDLSAAAEYDKYYTAASEESSTEGGDKHDRRGGDEESSWSSESETAAESGSTSFDLTAGEAWSVAKKEYVPVTTVINVANANNSLSATRVASAANTGGNAVFASSESEGGNSGLNLGTIAGASADAGNSAEVEDVEGGDAQADAYAHGNATAGADASSTTGNGGAGADSTTDSMIVSGRSDSIVTIVETSRHNVVRIQR